PPASDVVADRAAFAAVSARFAPRWPVFTSPKLTDMPVDDPNAPRTDADRAWAEVNHPWAGHRAPVTRPPAPAHATGRPRRAPHHSLARGVELEGGIPHRDHARASGIAGHDHRLVALARAALAAVGRPAARSDLAARVHLDRRVPHPLPGKLSCATFA